MPILLKKELSNGGEVGVWRVDEDIQYFEHRLSLFPAEEKEIEVLKPRKKLEWMASRYLLHLMSGRESRTPCLKDEHGKPYLQGSSYHISMSHSGDHVAVIAGPDSVGVDIQRIVTKIERLATKFLNEEELNRLDPYHRITLLHVLWGAKESLYKAYGRRGLQFKDHILTDEVVYDRGMMTTQGRVIKDDVAMSFDIFAHHLQDYILVYATSCD